VGIVTAIDRRAFLKTAGIGSVAATATLTMGASGSMAGTVSQLNFRATAGLPALPLPAWATQVVEGRIDTAAGTGLLISRLLAGHPGDPSEVALPGLSRVLRVTGVHRDGRRIRVDAVTDDRSQLQPGESPLVQIVIDQVNKVVLAPFNGRPITLRLDG
jgi:hypothetical protein